MKINRPYCLSIAGFDPTAGAGVLADIKTFEQFGVYGMGIISANTLQTDSQFLSVDWIKAETILQQLETLMQKYDFSVLKIGLIQDVETLYEVITLAKKLQPDLKIVWDPVLKSSSGFDFHSNTLFELSFLEQNCTVITPNWTEFEQLWGADVDVLLHRNLSTAVLLKGGHRPEKTGCDLLFHHGAFTEIQGNSFHGKTKHGTGCVLSSAIAAGLACGNALLTSCEQGKRFVEKFILSNDSNLGYHSVLKMCQ